MATKSLFVVTMPATVTVIVEASDDKEAKTSATKNAESVFGKSFGILHVVGDVKAAPVSTGKVKASAPKEEEEEEETEEEEEEEEAEEEEEEEEEEDEEEEEEEEEEEKPAKNKIKVGAKGDDKKSDDKKSDGKKKIKIRLKS